jgi:hypothetical protein
MLGLGKAADGIALRFKPKPRCALFPGAHPEVCDEMAILASGSSLAERGICSFRYFEYVLPPFFHSYVSAYHRDGSPRSASTGRHSAML